jgi:acetyl-CoA carboxylase biotin carboxyl carrier protein
VPDDAPLEPRPFDVPTIRALVALMSRHDLSEVDLSEGDKRIRLRRGPRKLAVATTPVLPMSVAGQPAVPPMPTTAAEDSKPAKPLHEIKSQLVGTFYTSAKPGSPPFVKIGDRVTPTTVVGIIEAMKIFNEIAAECTGVITEIRVENQQPVEYEQVLFLVDPTG